MKRPRVQQGIRDAYERASWTIQKSVQRFQKNPGDVLFEKREMQKLLKQKQDLVRNNAADNVRELQATVGRRNAVTKGGVGKKWPTVQTGVAKGVGVSKGGVATSKPFSYTTEPSSSGRIGGRLNTKRPVGKVGGFSMGKLAGLAKMGGGIAAGIAGEALAEEIRKHRDPNLPVDWAVIDTMNSILTMGASFFGGPILGALSKPVIEAITLAAQERARNHVVDGAMAVSPDEGAFLEWLTQEINKDKASKQKQGAPTDVGSLAYQERKRGEYESKYGKDEMGFLAWFAEEIRKDEALVGYSENDYGEEYQAKKRKEWKDKKGKYYNDWVEWRRKPGHGDVSYEEYEKLREQEIKRLQDEQAARCNPSSTPAPPPDPTLNQTPGLI